MNITLQYNSSERNAITKTTTDILSLEGTLKNNTSILDPHIIVNGDIATIRTANYMWIYAFGRKYFITDIISISKDLVEIRGHVDVLSSFATQIRNQRGITRRQEYNWNLYINDGTFKIYQNPIVETISFPSGFVTPEFVLAVAG